MIEYRHILGMQGLYPRKREEPEVPEMDELQIRKLAVENYLKRIRAYDVANKAEGFRRRRAGKPPIIAKGYSV